MLYQKKRTEDLLLKTTNPKPKCHMLSKTSRERLKCATFNHSRNTTYLVFVGYVSGGKKAPQNGPLQLQVKHWSLHREPGESLELHCNIQYCCRLVGVQFSEMKCQSIGKFLEKEKELVCLNVTKGDAGTDNAIYVAHTPEGQILPLEIYGCDPK